MFESGIGVNACDSQLRFEMGHLAIWVLKEVE
jgi:hypothetical protein